MKDFKIEADELEKVAEHLPTGRKFRFTPTDIKPESVDKNQMVLYDDLGGMWIGESIDGDLDQVLIEKAWAVANNKFWAEGTNPE